MAGSGGGGDVGGKQRPCSTQHVDQEGGVNMAEGRGTKAVSVLSTLTKSWVHVAGVGRGGGRGVMTKAV